MINLFQLNKENVLTSTKAFNINHPKNITHLLQVESWTEAPPSYCSKPIHFIISCLNELRMMNDNCGVYQIQT